MFNCSKIYLEWFDYLKDTYNIVPNSTGIINAKNDHIITIELSITDTQNILCVKKATLLVRQQGNKKMYFKNVSERIFLNFRTLYKSSEIITNYYNSTNYHSTEDD